MKFLITLLALVLITFTTNAQIRPTELFCAYYGEMISHPGIRVGTTHNMLNWTKTKKDKTLEKQLNFSPTLGFFYHKRYQTGINVIPEISFKRQNAKGRFIALGIGLGYLRTFTSNTYEVSSTETINKIVAGHNYALSQCSIAFGRDLTAVKDKSFSYYVKPQLMYALPNFPQGVGYFALELGISRKLK